jgi:hypothetical protein
MSQEINLFSCMQNLNLFLSAYLSCLEKKNMGLRHSSVVREFPIITRRPWVASPAKQANKKNKIKFIICLLLFVFTKILFKEILQISNSINTSKHGFFYHHPHGYMFTLVFHVFCLQ